MTCGDFPGPGVEHRLLANPLHDLIHTSPVGHAHRMFGHFKEKFERRYENEKEHEKREHNFVHNIRWVKKKPCGLEKNYPYYFIGNLFLLSNMVWKAAVLGIIVVHNMQPV